MTRRRADATPGTDSSSQLAIHDHSSDNEGRGPAFGRSRGADAAVEAASDDSKIDDEPDSADSKAGWAGFCRLRISICSRRRRAERQRAARRKATPN